MEKMRFLSVGLRALTLASKFSLIFFLAKFLSVADVGVYGLLVAVLGYGIYLIGLDFYTFSSRELIASEIGRRYGIIKNQFAVYMVWYLLSLPAVLILDHYGLIPRGYVGWVVCLLILDHLGQELNRILIALHQQVFAAVVLFIRTGIWGIVVAITQWLVPGARSVAFVLDAWVIGCTIACVLALTRLWPLIPRGHPAKLDMRWIAGGLAIAVPFFVASMAVRGMATFDRYMVENAAGLELLGVYVVFAGMATAVISFVDAAVVDFSYPKLVALARKNDYPAFLLEFRRTAKLILFIGVVLALAAGAGGATLIGFFDDSQYRENIYILYCLLVVSSISIASVIPHLGLYAMGIDGPIVRSQIAGFLLFVLVSLIFADRLGLDAVLAGLIAGWSCIFIWKWIAYRSVAPRSAN